MVSYELDRFAAWRGHPGWAVERGLLVTTSPVLVSWIAKVHDPFDPDGSGALGPTLTLLFDESSPYRGQIKEMVLLHGERDGEMRSVNATLGEIESRAPEIKVHHEVWTGDDPTDHGTLFEFMRGCLTRARRRFRRRELVVHISPGTPSMQTIWVLMGETGFIDEPFCLVKSYRERDRRGRLPVVPVQIDLETFFKVYRVSRPSSRARVEQDLLWEPHLLTSEKLRTLFVEARRYAHLNVPVMLLGERGTGKTTLASWIRANSPFRRREQDQAWPAVACGQYSAETMRAELFGYVKGAFTGAIRDHDGLLAKAHRDTLFLDEVGDVSRDLQRLLIKALEEKRYYRLGEDVPKDSDFRLITATNLEAQRLAERLDPDFLDRISMVRLVMPPLREISEDLPRLWEDLYARTAGRLGISAGKARLGQQHHRKVVDLLTRHPLPGNLRDLLRVAHRILASRSDPHESLQPAEAVEYGLGCLAGSEPEGDLVRSVAACFARHQPLDPILARAGRLQTQDVIKELQMYMATEVLRYCQQQGHEVKDVCDRTDRSLRTWKAGGK